MEYNIVFPRATYKEGSWEHIKDPVGTVKYDGAHFFLSFDNEGNPSYISRRQSVKGHYPDRTEKLPQLTKRLPEYANTIHAVELIHTGHSKGLPESHPNISGILNSLTPRALETQVLTGPVRAVLLDTLKPNIDTYAEKLSVLRGLAKAFNKPDLIFVPEAKLGKDEVQALVEKTRAEGREGVIITSASQPESSNPRIKVKHFDHYNLKVVGITPGTGKYKGSGGSLIVEDASGRIVANVGTGFSDEQRRSMHELLGKVVQVKAFPSTAQRLRAPVYNGEGDGEIDRV